MSYQTQVKKLVKEYLKRFGLHHWRMTRLYIGIPRHIKRELTANYPDAQNGFYACVYPTSRNTFVMAVSRDIPEAKLESVVAHEVSHILLHHLYEATRDGRRYDAKRQLEIVCDRIAHALTRPRCA